MIWLILALLASTSIMIGFKLYPRFNINSLQSISVNYLVAFFAGLITLSTKNQSPDIHSAWLPLSLISGIFLALTFFVFSKSAAKVGIALTSVSSKMSVIIPVILGFFLFKETIQVFKVLGIIVSLPAFYFIFKNKGFNKLKSTLILLPLLLFIGNGTNDSLLKSAQFYFLRNNDDYINYLTIAFAVSFLICTILVFYNRIINKTSIKFKNIIAGIVLGILNWYSTLFFLNGLSTTDVTVFIPIFNAGIVSLGAFTGVIFFKENLTKWNFFGLFLAIIAIILIAVSNG